MFEIYKSTTKNQKNKCFLGKMFQNIINLFEIFSLYMTMILILCDYPCGKEVEDSVHSDKVPDSDSAMALPLFFVRL